MEHSSPSRLTGFQHSSVKAGDCLLETSMDDGSRFGASQHNKQTAARQKIGLHHMLLFWPTSLISRGSAM